jgi:hypothetical protein
MTIFVCLMEIPNGVVDELSGVLAQLEMRLGSGSAELLPN